MKKGSLLLASLFLLSLAAVFAGPSPAFAHERQVSDRDVDHHRHHDRYEHERHNREHDRYEHERSRHERERWEREKHEHDRQDPRGHERYGHKDGERRNPDNLTPNDPAREDRHTRRHDTPPAPTAPTDTARETNHTRHHDMPTTPATSTGSTGTTGATGTTGTTGTTSSESTDSTASK